MDIQKTDCKRIAEKGNNALRQRREQSTVTEHDHGFHHFDGEEGTPSTTHPSRYILPLAVSTALPSQENDRPSRGTDLHRH